MPACRKLHRIESLESRTLLNTGDLNLAFGGGDGRIRVAPPVAGGVVVNVAAQPDGKFVVGGYAVQPHKNYVWLERFDAKGNVDKSFGSNGVVKTLVSDVQDGCFADFARQSDGKFVVVTVRKGGGFLARYTSSGKLDTSFGGGDGIVLTNAGLSIVLALPNGKIAACNGDVFEFNSDGSTYTGFGTKGVVHVASVLSGVKNLWLRNMSAQSDNKILLTGAVETTTYTLEDATVTVRLTTSGKADKTLNGSGMIVADIGDYEGGWGVATQSNGNIITAASDDDDRGWLLGNKSNGSAIPGFIGGAQTFGSSQEDLITGVSIFGKDQILFFGAVADLYTLHHDYAVIGFDPLGVKQFSKTIDFSWIDSGDTDDIPVAAIQSADGNILMVGNSGESDGGLPSTQIEIVSLQGKPGGPSDAIPIALNGDQNHQTDQMTLTGTAGSDVIRLLEGDGNYGIEYNGNRAFFWLGNLHVIVNAGNGNDRVENLTDVPMTLNGGGGNDTLVGSKSSETFIGGPGTDTADYSARTDNLNITLDNKPNDGAANEKDNVNSDVENVLGGSGNDKLVGNPFNNVLKGNAGNDTLYGGAGNDTLDGGSGRDMLFGQDGNDTLLAKDGRTDSLDGGNGLDTAQRDNSSTIKDSVLNIESFI